MHFGLPRPLSSYWTNNYVTTAVSGTAPSLNDLPPFPSPSLSHVSPPVLAHWWWNSGRKPRSWRVKVPWEVQAPDPPPGRTN